MGMPAISLAHSRTEGGIRGSVPLPRVTGSTLLGLLAAAVLCVRFWLLMKGAADPTWRADAFTYYSSSLGYSRSPGPPGAFLYPPLFWQLLAPFRLLPFDLFYALWVAAELACLIYLVGPMGAAALAFVPVVATDMWVGHVYLFMAAALALSLGRPTWWWLLSIKATTFVGVLYHAFRREWRAFFQAAGLAGGLVSLSFLIAPDAWFRWLALSRDSPPAWELFLAARLTFAVFLVAYAAWRRLPWVVPIAVTLSVPIFWPESIILMLASLRLVRTTDSAPWPRRIATAPSDQAVSPGSSLGALPPI